MSEVTAEDIASAMRTAYEDSPTAAFETICTYFGDTLEVINEPPSIGAGNIETSVLRAMRAAELAAFTNALADYRENAEISASGDQLTIRRVVTGTLPDGTAVHIEPVSVYTIESGVVTRMLNLIEPDVMGVVLKVIEIGGFDMSALQT